MKKILIVIMLFAILFTSVVTENSISFASNNAIEIYIGDSSTVRHHMAIALGDTSDEYHFKIEGYQIKSSTYSSSSSAFRIVKTGEGRCKVESVAEGTGYVNLTVKTEDDKTFNERVFVSVYARIERCQARAIQKTNVYRGASSNSDVENEDKKGTLAKNESVVVLASCSNYYLFKTNDGSVYEDDKDTGFVKKSDLEILVGTVVIKEKNPSIEIGKSMKLNATVSPNIAANKNLLWDSTNKKVASVSSEGKVSGVSEGIAVISATSTDGSNKTGNTFVSAYRKINEAQGYIKSDANLYALGSEQYNIGTVKTGTNITVLGVCGNYYRIKVAKQLIEEEYDGFCYVLKTKVTIPVAGVKLNKNQVLLSPGRTIRLNSIVTPDIADNKIVNWITSNKKVAVVNSEGYVTAKKTGNAVVTAISADGKKSDKCEILVTETKYQNKAIKSKTTLFVNMKSLNKISLTIRNIEAYNGFTIYLNGKKYKNYNFKKRKGGIEKTLAGLKVNKLYKIKVNTFLKKGNKKTYKKMSDVQKVIVGKVSINANALKSKSITVSWGKISGVKNYRVYRSRTRLGKYKLIKTLTGKKNSYLDKNVKLNKTYYYKVKPVGKKGEKASSNIDYATACKLKNSVKYISKKYKVVCTEKGKNINSYNIKGTYSPVKYKFVDDTLQIHVYLEFATYSDTGKLDAEKTKIYEKKKASVKSEIPTAEYISMFKRGVKNAYKVNVIGGKGDFKKGVNFSTKIFIHEKYNKEKYNSKQKFIEVLIGGECPNCTKVGDHWYHTHILDNAEGYYEYGDDTMCIYMPTHEQVRQNKIAGYRNPYDDIEGYGVTAAHELGHTLGLDDAYFGDGYDRCADNNETGYEYQDKQFDNVMKGGFYYKIMNANEIEMMLKAVDEDTGMPDHASQCFKTYEDYKISKVIKNHYDYQKDS